MPILMLIFSSLWSVPEQPIATPDVKQLMEVSLEKLLAEKVIKKNEDGTYPGLGLVTNGFISEDLSLSVMGKPVEVEETEEDMQVSDVLHLNYLKVHPRQAKMTFSYGKYRIKLTTVKRGDNWDVKKYTAKKKGGLLFFYSSETD